MGTLVGGDEPLSRDPRVHLGRAQARVAEQLLDDAKVGATVEQVRREAVAECMWMARDRRAPVEYPSHVARAEPRASSVQQHRSRRRLRAGEHWPPPLEVRRERLDARAAHGQPPSLRALAPDAHRGDVELEVADVESAAFGDAQPRAVEQLEDCVVPQVARDATLIGRTRGRSRPGRRAGRLEQLAQLRMTEDAWQAGVSCRCAQPAGRVDRDMAGALRPREVAPKGSRLAGDRASRIAAGREIGEIAPQDQAVDPRRRGDARSSRPGHERVDVAGVRDDGRSRSTGERPLEVLDSPAHNPYATAAPWTDTPRGSPRGRPRGPPTTGADLHARALSARVVRAREDGGMSSHILLVEDDERIRASMRLALEDEGYELSEAASGEEALELAAQATAGQPFELLIIDIMLPGMDGFACCRELRRHSAVPIIMVTARTDTHDVVAGLEAGADDYVTKPFEPKELAARIRALLRRARATDGNAASLTFGDLEILPEGGVVRLAGEEVHLTRTEFLLLCELAANAGKVLSREQLLERVWSYDYFGDGRLVDVHVRRLRTKVEPDPANPRHVLTVRGLGYKLAP